MLTRFAEVYGSIEVLKSRLRASAELFALERTPQTHKEAKLGVILKGA